MLTIMNMNPVTRETFYRIKPLCELVIQDPSAEHITMFSAVVDDLKLDMLQELQQYLLLPFIHHLQCEENRTKYDLQIRILEPMKEVLTRVKVCNFQICMKILGLLVKVVFNKSKLVIISEVPEELKLSVVQCLTTLMLNIDQATRIRILESQLSLLAQSIFVSVHLAKLEKLRTLRLAALNCLDVLMMIHPQITDSNNYIADPILEEAVLNMMAGILPGVLAALQDVATCPDNPGHAVIAAALSSTHRIICIIMHNKNLPTKDNVTATDFLNMVSQKGEVDNDVSTKESIRDANLNPNLRSKDNRSLAEYLRTKRKNTKFIGMLKPRGSVTRPKNVKRKSCVKDVGSRFQEKCDSILTGVEAKPKRSPQWYAMASDKLSYVVKYLIPLVTHENYKVRLELAVLCYRILSECSATMEPSLAMTLDVLITLSTDPYKEVSDYCSKGVESHFASASKERKIQAIDSLCENFFTTLNCLPRILINIDSSRKLSVLTLLYGYLKILCDDSRPQRLTSALSASDGFDRLCDALLTAADLQTDLALLTRHSGRDVTSKPSTDTPWCRLRHLDTNQSEKRLQEVCQKLGAAECAELFLDRLMELFHEKRSCELVYIINWVGSAPNSSPSLAKRIISKYIEEDIWYLPLEVASGETPVTKVDTLDTSVYNPRAWSKDSVPGLYEGTVETRYTGISYAQPRLRYIEPNTCKTIAEAQRNMAFSCLVTEGLGMMARRLKTDYQPFLLKTLCLLLERVGSKYENLHLTGVKALNDVAFAFDHSNVAELIAENADYFTSQVTSRLKKAWNTQSALHILSVVMEYSESNILDYLYGIVEDVLIQCCDQYYQRHLYAYLQVFLTFVNCIRKWFLIEPNKPQKQTQAPEIDIMKDVMDFIKNTEEATRLLNAEDEKESKMTAEEMYKEDIKRKEQDILDYDDTVAAESPPTPQHIRVTVAILKRCVNFIGGSTREESLMAIRTLTLGLPILEEYENELLPLAHLAWAPLVAKFTSTEPSVLKGAFELFVVLASLAKDFLRSRAVRDVLHPMYKFLACTALQSQLKDTGSAYRLSTAYTLQLVVLSALPALLADLALDDERLMEAMTCAQRYLSNKQPKPLQMLAVKFFKELLSYNYCVAWFHLRHLCNNEVHYPPPYANIVPLVTVLGTPYETDNEDFDGNIKLIFYVHK